MADVGDRIELMLSAKSDRFDQDDPGWRAQVGQLREALMREGGALRVDATPVPGTKGGVEALILALGSAGAFTAAVEALKVWLRRDRSRSIEIAWREGEQQRSVTVRGDDIDTETLRAVTLAVTGAPGEA